MQHLNGNILAAIDVETTGLVAGFHDLWQIAVVPLDYNLKPTNPFYMDLRVKRPDNIDKAAIKVCNTDFFVRQKRAIDPWTCADLFEEWFTRLALPVGKRLVPLGSNWIFDRGFIIDWLGKESFDSFFHYLYRDTQVAALFLNDTNGYRGRKIEFPKVGLGSLVSRLGATNLKPHDALQDALASAEVYRRLIMGMV